MTTTRIRFVAALSPSDNQPYTQFHIEAPGVDLPFTPIPALNLTPHQTAIDNYKTANGGGGNIVSDVGEALWQCLNSHGNADEAFRPSLSPGAPDPWVSLSFSDGTADAKDLPWEALRENAGFLCFDKRIPIVREVETPVENPALTLLEGEKLRFLAVIAASGDDGRGEWRALKRAVKSANDRMPIEVLVLTSNPNIVTDIEQNENQFFSAGPVPEGASALIQRIQSFRPHIAHFFCHGHANGFLEVERSSAEFGAVEPTWLSVAHLEEALALSTWVTVLNACSLASTQAATPEPAGSLNLCEQLVESSVPIVVGMRAPVDAGDAQAFAESFHTNTLRVLADLFTAGTGRLSLAKCFGDACRAILSLGSPMEALQKPAWTLPVMNLRPDTLQFERVKPAAVACEPETEAPQTCIAYCTG